jgi:RsiW-degrading membrane proteinase PrsW (M82 family)
MNWFYMDGDKQYGPVDDGAAKALIAAGSITPVTLVFREGTENWIPASESELKGCFRGPGAALPPSVSAAASKTGHMAANLVNAGQRHAQSVIGDLKQMDWKAEVLPIDQSNLAALARDGVFWSVALLGVVPLLIGTIQANGSNTQLTAFALFFAAIWGVIFRKYVLKGVSDLKVAVGSLFFTGIAGINMLLWLYSHVLPNACTRMCQSDNLVVSLFGFVFHVGILEELCKVLPVLIYLAWKRRAADPLAMVEIGVFSGLGFAAFENVSYGHASVLSSYSLASRYGAAGLAVGVQNAMVNTMLRSLSLVFCHAVWAGTFSYFVSVAAATRKRCGALFVVGLSVSALLHGLYNWFTGVQPTVSALLAGFSFILFYGYLSKLRKQAVAADAVEDDDGTEPERGVG